MLSSCRDHTQLIAAAPLTLRPPVHSRGRAFTLVELLVVVAIIALLLAILLPSLAGARKAAKGTVCLVGLRSMGQAVVMYCSDNQERFPVSSHTVRSLAATNAWLTTLEGYGVDLQARLCPVDEYRARKKSSYATNEHFEPLAAGVDYNPVSRQPLAGGRRKVFDRLTLLPRPDATIYVYEPEGDGSADHLNTHAFANADQLRASVAVTRHLGAGHYLFADGHATPWAWADLAARFTPRTSPFDPETAR